MCQNNNQLEPMQSEQQVETAASFLLCDCFCPEPYLLIQVYQGDDYTDWTI